MSEKLEWKNYRFITPLSVFFVVVLIVSNIVSTKLTTIWAFTFDGGTILFPLSYIFGDIITEVYWYKEAKKIIYLWFISALFTSSVIILVWVLPSASDWHFQEAYNQILWLTPRIVLASLIAYFVGEFSNSYILAKIKIWMKGKYLFVRTIGSTIVGEFFDTILFVLIAFYGVFPDNVLLIIIISNYIFKVWVEILFTPLTYLIVNKLKKAENIDFYDKKTNFNPFKF